MILNGVENKINTGLILINLQNAFYNLDHKILPDKMKSIGFSDKALSFWNIILHCHFRSRIQKTTEFPKNLYWDICICYT